MYVAQPVMLGTACRPQILDHRCISCCDPPPAPPDLRNQNPGRTQTARPTPRPKATIKARPTIEIRADCLKALYRWAQANPAKAQCFNRQDNIALSELCSRWGRGLITSAEYQKAFDELVARACARQVPRTTIRNLPPPPPPPPVQARVPPPVPAPPTSPVKVVVPPIDAPVPTTVATVPNGHAPPRAQQQTEPTMFRKWGPIAGVLLIVGGAVYLLR